MELVVLIALLIFLVPIAFGLIVSIACVLLSVILVSGGFFFVVANEVAYNRMPPFMLLFAFGLALMAIPLVIMAIRGIARGIAYLVEQGRNQIIIAKGEKPKKKSSVKAAKTSAKSEKSDAPAPRKQQIVLPILAALGLACVVGSFVVSAVSRQPFWPALSNSSWFQRAEQKEATFTPSDISRIVVDVNNEPIIVRADTTATVVTVRYSDIPDNKTTELSLQDGVLTIGENRHYRLMNFGFFAESSQIEIIVPSNRIITYSLETNNGRIIVDGVRTWDLTAVTSNGRIELTDVESDRLDVKTSNGRIVLTRLSSKDTRLKTSNGAIEGSVFGNLDEFDLTLKTSNGRVTVNGEHFDDDHTQTGGDHPFTATTSNGKIDLEFNR
jgi:hypothetical protein